jgi:hypothetical protein
MASLEPANAHSEGDRQIADILARLMAARAEVMVNSNMARVVHEGHRAAVAHAMKWTMLQSFGSCQFVTDNEQHAGALAADDGANDESDDRGPDLVDDESVEDNDEVVEAHNEVVEGNDLLAVIKDLGAALNDLAVGLKSLVETQDDVVEVQDVVVADNDEVETAAWYKWVREKRLAETRAAQEQVSACAVTDSGKETEHDHGHAAETMAVVV